MQPKIDYNPQVHIRQLDGIRGCAILFVLMYHFFGDYFAPFRIGWAGVDLFFVLSGFLITGILVDSSESKSYYKDFYIKRSLRIFPIYYLVLIVCILLFPLFLRTLSYDAPYYSSNQGWFWTYTQNWLFTIKGFPDDRLLRHTWSLCIEEQFYLIWPFLIRTNKQRIIYFLVGFIILSNVLRSVNLVDDSFKYVNTVARLDALSIGGLIAVLIRTNKALLEKWANRVLWTSLAAVVLIMAFKRSLNFGNLHESYTFIALMFGSILVWALSSNLPGVFKSFFSSRILIFFGKHSYGLYLYHRPLLFAGEFYLSKYLLEKKGISHVFAYDLLGKVVLLLISILLSYISFRFVEKPIINLRYKLISSGKRSEKSVPQNLPLQ